MKPDKSGWYISEDGTVLHNSVDDTVCKVTFAPTIPAIIMGEAFDWTKWEVVPSDEEIRRLRDIEEIRRLRDIIAGHRSKVSKTAVSDNRH